VVPTPRLCLCDPNGVLNGVAPFFIVDDFAATVEFYVEKLGFEVIHKGEFWAMVGRDDVHLFLKHITSEVHPQPNHTRHEWASWDAYIFTSDPDALFAEFVARAVPIHRDLGDTDDGLRGFEVRDNNGYVLCFARPLLD
jgi:catechol 2,3-dioxygenase-like lactoylglutathione lyase family enzyme